MSNKVTTRPPARVFQKHFSTPNGSGLLTVRDFTGNKWRNDDIVRGRETVVVRLPATDRGSYKFKNNFKHSITN